MAAECNATYIHACLVIAHRVELRIFNSTLFHSPSLPTPDIFF